MYGAWSDAMRMLLSDASAVAGEDYDGAWSDSDVGDPGDDVVSPVDGCSCGSCRCRSAVELIGGSVAMTCNVGDGELVWLVYVRWCLGPPLDVFGAVEADDMSERPAYDVVAYP